MTVEEYVKLKKDVLAKVPAHERKKSTAEKTTAVACIIYLVSIVTSFVLFGFTL